MDVPGGTLGTGRGREVDISSTARGLATSTFNHPKRVESKMGGEPTTGRKNSVARVRRGSV